MTATPELVRLADWVVSCRGDDVPERFEGLLQAQLLSVAAATLSGRATEDGQAVWRMTKRVSASKRIPLPGGGTAGVLAALDAATSWSMAQDYDDYMFMGHTGHSAIWVPLIVGAWLDAPAAEVRTAMLIMNELGGRLGASLLLGPHNGQMWVPLHRLAAAAGTARLLGLDAEQTAHAMAIALYEANDPVFHGFMGPGSKVRSAATSVVAGVQAALLAAEGLTGALDILEHPRGFWKRFTFTPLRGTFSGLGQSWVTDTLAIKPVPGCAYVDSTVEALEDVMAQYQAQHGEPLEPYMVDRVRVEAGVLTVGMDALSRDAVAAGLLSPVVVNFSIPLTAASLLVFGELTGATLNKKNLAEHAEPIREVADRVELIHDPAMSLQLIRDFDQELPFRQMIGAVPLSELRQLRRRAREQLGNEIDQRVFGRRKKIGRDDWRPIVGTVLKPLVRKLAEPLYGHPVQPLDLGDVDFRRLRMSFPSQVSVSLRSGETLRARCEAPRGTHTRGDQLAVAEAKWHREAAAHLGKKERNAVVRAVQDPATPPRALLELLQ